MARNSFNPKKVNLTDRHLYYVIGNKCEDPKREVTYEEAHRWVQNYNMKHNMISLTFMEMSCKDNINCRKLFKEIP